MKATSSSHHGNRLSFQSCLVNVRERVAVPHAVRRSTVQRGPRPGGRRSVSPQRVIRFSDSVATSPAHLRVAALALDELDRHLGDPQAGPHGAEGQVGLEHVAERLDLLEPDRLQRRTTEQAVAGGGVPHADAEQRARVEVAAARQQLAVSGQLTMLPPGPSASRSPGRRRGSALQQPVQLLGLVRPVGVHLADHVVPAVERHPEAVQVRRAEALLGGRCSTVTCGSAAAIWSASVPGAVGRVVVDDEDVHLGWAVRSRPTSSRRG